MGLFVRDDDYDESHRMTGFNRYKQLLSFFAGHWVKLNLISLENVRMCDCMYPVLWIPYFICTNHLDCSSFYRILVSTVRVPVPNL